MKIGSGIWNKRLCVAKEAFMKKLKNNDGSTMVEVLVSFTVLMIIMVSLYGIVRVSTNMLMKSKDFLTTQQEFSGEYYKKNYGSLTVKDSTSEAIKLIEINSNGENKARGSNITLEHAKKKELTSDTSSISYTVIVYE
jgi:hypothetical protein